MSLCLTLSVLPATALAGGLDTVKTYDELREKLESQTGTIYVEPSENFGWPETGTLTIRANSTIRAVNSNDQKTAWEIPAGITVNFEMDCRGIQCTELTINGTMHMVYSSQDAVLRDCDKVIIGPTGTFSCAEDNPAYPTTVYTVYIPVGQTWEVQAGGTLNPGVRLDGTLTGSGTVSGTVSARGGLSSEASNGILSGTLTLTGSVEVGQWNSGTYADRLTIPSGSCISFQPAKSGSILINENATLILNGQLDISGSRSGRTNGISLQNTGELQMGAGSVLSLHYPYELSWSYQEDVPQPTDPLVTGSGTIQYHADDVSQLARYCLFYRDITGRDMSFETACEGLFPTYIENGVTLWRSWACDHIWDDGEETRPATCTEPGETTYTCTKCGVTRMEEIPATGHTEVIDEAVAATCTEEGKTQGSHCSVCGAVITAQETIPALGHLWSTNDCAQQATCSRCDAIRPAGAHIWGAWTETPATCTEEGSRSHTCTSCGHQETQTIPALGHSWGDWVLTTPPTEAQNGVETRVCSRCDATEIRDVAKLERQDIRFPASSMTKTYGDPEVHNTAMNMTPDGDQALTYTSSDPTVAVVDPVSGKIIIKGAGTSIITATADAVANKYVETSASFDLTVNKAALTIRAADASIVYGQPAPAFSWTAQGFVYQEDESVLAGQADWTCPYKTYGAVGTYPITLSGLSAQNYAITFAAGTLTVSKAEEYTVTLGKLEQLAGHTTPVTAAISPYDTTARISVEYLVNDSWTDTVPTEVGTYAVRAALTDSDNISFAPGSYTEDFLLVKRGVTVDTGSGAPDVDVSVDVDSGKAEISLSEDDLNTILENANGSVSVDLGGVSNVDQLVLPGNLVSELSKNDKTDSLAVSTEDASITLSAPVLDTVAGKITSGEDTVAATLKSVNKDDLSEAQQEALKDIPEDAKVVDVSLTVTHPDGSQDILHELGGDVTITVPYDELPGVMEGQYVVACHVADNGVVTYLFAVCDPEARTITFTSTHFSNYAVFVSERPAVIVTDGDGSGLYAVGETVTITADSRSGYRFDHWDIVSGGVSLADVSSAEITFAMPREIVELRAVYTKASTGGGGGSSVTTSYAVSTANTENGTITAEPQRAAKGDTVTLTVKPDQGYQLDTLTVTDRNGKEILVTEKDDKYTFPMPASKVTVKATFIKNEQPGETAFTDVPADAYYAEAVQWAVAKGITTGTSATTFSPESGCTRGQIVTFLWRAAGSPVVSDAVGFTDVAADAYYAEAVRWAVAQGITAGTSATTFSPESVCTRGQIVTFLFRANGQTAAAAQANPFHDVAVDSYYYAAVLWAAESGITAGTSATTFSPDAACTRGQIMTFLFRAMGK